jgi:hypothetical protein
MMTDRARALLQDFGQAQRATWAQARYRRGFVMLAAVAAVELAAAAVLVRSFFLWYLQR